MQSALALMIVGAVTVACGWGAVQGRFSRDGPGIRTPTTLKTEEAWHAAQRAGGALMLSAGVAIIVAAIGVGLVASPWRNPYLAGVAVIYLGLMTAATVRGAQAAKRAPTARNGEGDQP